MPTCCVQVSAERIPNILERVNSGHPGESFVPTRTNNMECPAPRVATEDVVEGDRDPPDPATSSPITAQPLATADAVQALLDLEGGDKDSEGGDKEPVANDGAASASIRGVASTLLLPSNPSDSGPAAAAVAAAAAAPSAAAAPTAGKSNDGMNPLQQVSARTAARNRALNVLNTDNRALYELVYRPASGLVPKRGRQGDKDYRSVYPPFRCLPPTPPPSLIEKIGTAICKTRDEEYACTLLFPSLLPLFLPA
jgi:hypothetical protein